MKAIILASGVGSRLLPFTKDKPKSLIKINSKTIIEHQLDKLLDTNIKEVVITTGPFRDAIEKIVEEKYKNFNFSFVYNPEYDSTNYIYSLWLTKNLIDDDIVLFHGDLLFTKKLFKNIIKRDKNMVLVNKKIKPPKKDFKALIKNEKILKIGVDLTDKNAYLCLPLYKICKKDFLTWIYEMEKEIKDGNLNIYAEDAFNKI